MIFWWVQLAKSTLASPNGNLVRSFLQTRPTDVEMEMAPNQTRQVEGTRKLLANAGVQVMSSAEATREVSVQMSGSMPLKEFLQSVTRCCVGILNLKDFQKSS